MRPLKISMQAFGPYLGTEVVDFEALGERRMFLISGDTGAGKSTILDAMCFALYGESTGDERAAADMRSKNAPPKLETSIELTFSVGEKSYRVVRSPAQTRPKQRGDGVTNISAKATLVRLENTKETALASQPRKVTDEIIALLGFTAIQFRQVVVLPQGQFRKFLSSSSDERQKILSDLFRTWRYERVEQALKDRARAVTQQLSTVNAKIDGLLLAQEVESESALTTELESVESSLETATVELQTRTTLLTNALESLNQGKSLADHFNKRTALAARIKEIEATADEQIERETRLASAERALRVKAEFDAHTQLNKQHSATSARLEAAKKQETEVSERLTATAATSHLEQAREVAGAGTHKLEQLRAELTEIAANTETTAAVEQEGKATTALIENHQRYAKALGEVKRLEADIGETEGGLESARRDLKKASDELARLEEARDRGQATLIARTLTDGTPCPVCGSTTHPAPADSTIDIPDDSDVKGAREKITTQQSRVDETGQTLGRLTGERKSTQNEANSLEKLLGDDAQTPVSTLEQARDRLKGRYREAQTRETRRVEITNEVAGIEKNSGEAEARLVELTAKATELNEAVAARRSARDTILARLPEEFRSPGSIDAAITATSQKQQELVATIEGARKQHAEASTASTQLASEIKTQSETLAKMHSDLEAAAAAWRTKREEANFDTDAAWQAAFLEDDSVKTLQAAVTQYRTELDQARGALTEAETACAGQVMPDLVQLQKLHDEAAALFDTLKEDSSRKRVRSEALRSTSSQIKEARGGQQSLDDEFRVVQHLADVARYVLGVILDEVLVAATHRLLHLSRGRYRLERRIGVGDQRRAGGLELDVFDGDTGESRPVSTLSGGEGFQAALALALGLAEVTQNHAGGIRLETLFVDEGFGSLDQEALQAAISTLIEANRDGRLIGIISHVSELKEHIDTRLDIHKTVTGSSTQWVVP